jgi:hypothetical protein
MKKYYFVLALFIFLLTACSGEATYSYGTPTSTPNPGEIALNMIQQQMAAESTQQIVELQFTATAMVLGATATAQQGVVYAEQTVQARVDAEATAAQARKSAEATAQQERVNAEATSQQARMDIAATQQRMDMESTQSAQATAVWDAITMTAMPPAATMTQIAYAQSIALANNEIEKSNLEVEKARQTNTVDWVIKYSVVLMAAIVGALFVIRYSRTREVRNEDGDVQVLVLDNNTVISPKLLAGPVLEVDSMTMPELINKDEQREVTKRAQTIDALKAIPSEPSKNAMPLFADVFGTHKKEEPFEIIEGETMPPAGLLDAEALKSLEKDWKEANRE